MIRLHSLTLSRFRGVREGSIQGLGDVNLLIGRNNSGKTTVAEALTRLPYRLGGVVQDLLGRGIDQLWQQPRNESSEFPAELWYRQDQNRVLIVEAKLRDTQGGNATYALRVKVDQGTTRAEPAVTTAEIDSGQAYQVVAAMTLFRPVDASNRNIENRLWPRLLATRRDKALTVALNEIFGLNAEGLQLLPDQRLMVLFPDHSLPLDVQGDGTRTALRALIVLTMLKGTLFIMEEPECHQHPGSLERFALALCKQAREQEVQLMISTHSAECVRAFLTAAQAVKSEGAVFHLTLEQGQLQARRLDQDAVETLQSTGVDVRFLDLYA